MRLWVLRKGLALAAALALVLGTAGAASALGITLNGDERLTGLFSANPGSSYGTGGAGVVYDGAGNASLTGSLTTISYTIGGVLQPTASVNLDISLSAVLTGISATNVAGSVYDIEMTFGTATPTIGSWDLIVTDPDAGNAEVLRGDLVPTNVFGTPTEAIVVTGTGVDITDPQPVLQAQAFFRVDSTSPYASLFIGASPSDPLMIGLTFSSLLNFSPDFTVIGAGLTSGSPTLVANTSQAIGSAFIVDNPGITPIPEPGTALLVGIGLIGVAARRRSA